MTLSTSNRLSLAASTPFIISLSAVVMFGTLIQYHEVVEMRSRAQVVNWLIDDDDYLINYGDAIKDTKVMESGVDPKAQQKTTPAKPIPPVDPHLVAKWKSIDLKAKQHHFAANHGPVVKARAQTPKINNRTIYFLHIHKSGGSTMCQAARANRMTSDFQHNCNVQHDQRCCGDTDTLQAHEEFFKKSKYSFVASEKHMYDTMDNQHFFYVMTLRESKARYISHYNHVKRDYPARVRGQFKDWWSLQPDNFSLRMICGPDCVNTPKYKITKMQFEATVERLKNFDSIILLEDFENTYHTFANKVGWKGLSLKKKANEGSYNKNLKNFIFDRMMGALDNALYEYGQQLFQGKSPGDLKLSTTTQVDVNYYFENGPKRGCKDKCCGKCSQYRI